jgi:primosomal protein N' (replication factor Y)
MIAKGHDFPGIQLVGVVLADIALALPDFRASERAFSLLTQVAGRAGRGEKRGRVLVQTYNPTHPSLVHLVTHDVHGFADEELELRSLARYPPYWRAAIARVEGDDPTQVARLAADVATYLSSRAQAGTVDVLGPAPCPLERLRGKTRFQVFVRTKGTQERGSLLFGLARDVVIARDLSRARCRLILDVDPAHML